MPELLRWDNGIKCCRSSQEEEGEKKKNAFKEGERNRVSFLAQSSLCFSLKGEESDAGRLAAPVYFIDVLGYGSDLAPHPTLLHLPLPLLRSSPHLASCFPGSLTSPGPLESLRLIRNLARPALSGENEKPSPNQFCHNYTGKVIRLLISDYISKKYFSYFSDYLILKVTKWE